MREFVDKMLDPAVAGAVVALFIKWRGVISGVMRAYDKLKRNGHGGVTDSKLYALIERRMDAHDRDVRMEEKLDRIIEWQEKNGER